MDKFTYQQWRYYLAKKLLMQVNFTDEEAVYPGRSLQDLLIRGRAWRAYRDAKSRLTKEEMDEVRRWMLLQTYSHLPNVRATVDAEMMRTWAYSSFTKPQE